MFAEQKVCSLRVLIARFLNYLSFLCIVSYNNIVIIVYHWLWNFFPFLGEVFIMEEEVRSLRVLVARFKNFLPFLCVDSYSDIVTIVCD